MKASKLTPPSFLFSMIRQTLAFICLAACVNFTIAQTPLPIYEPFPSSYTNTSDGTTQVPPGGSTYPFRNLGNTPTSTLWALGNTAGGGSAIVVGGPASLTYPGLYHDPGTPSLGLFIRTNTTSANRNRGILFPTN